MADNPLSFKIYAETLLPTDYGHFRFRCYRNDHGDEAIALATRYFDRSLAVNVRIHSSCMTSEVFHSMRCDCREQLETALSYIAEHSGLVIYLLQEGRGIGLGDKIRAYALQEQGYDTLESNQVIGLPPEARRYDAAVDILNDLQVQTVNLMTNNPEKIAALTNNGIDVAARLPSVIPPNPFSEKYLQTKREKCGHW